MSEDAYYGVGRWRRYSAEDGGFYFHNEETGQSVWDPPPGWVDPPNDPRRSTSARSPASAPADAAMGTSDLPLQERAPSGDDGRHHRAPTRDEIAMNPGEIDAMKRQAGSAPVKQDPHSNSFGSEPTPKARQQQQQQQQPARDKEPRGPLCGDCECNKTCLIIFLIVFGIIIIIVLASVLTLDHAVSCHSSDEGYFVKKIPPPVLLSVAPNLLCTVSSNTTVSVVGTGFLWYNSEVPKLKIGSLSVSAFNLQGCEEVTGVKGQTVALCTSFSAVIPVTEPTTLSSYNAVVENPTPNEHPAAKQKSPCTATLSNYMLLGQEPNVTMTTPEAVCTGSHINVMVSGGGYFSYLPSPSSSWVNPLVTLSNGYRVAPSALTLDGCTNVSFSQYNESRVCTSLSFILNAANLPAYPESSSFMVSNPSTAGTCPSMNGGVIWQVPRPAIIDVDVPVVLNTASTAVNFNGTFLRVGGVAPSVSVDNTTVTTAVTGCVFVNGSTSVEVCTGLSITVPPMTLGNTTLVPSVVISNPIDGCAETFTPIAIVGQLAFNAAQLPVLCPNTTLNQEVLFTGNFVIYDMMRPAFFINGAPVGASDSNPALCLPVNTFGSHFVSLCSQYKILVRNPLSGPTEFTVSASPAPGLGVSATSPSKPFVGFNSMITTGSAVCVNTNFTLSGTFLNEGSFYPTIVLQGVTVPAVNVTGTGCTQWTTNSRLCSQLTIAPPPGVPTGLITVDVVTSSLCSTSDPLALASVC